ncbi:MAG: PD-(D/E)XK nuclease family protein, partial [Parasphingopyxis sp.]|uniref:PD-(D/E)XK nuclease family protein n=1 Tax=Parasphingopyxis sp. TaxID=1920299 RepID=UPI0032EC986C
LSEPEEPDWIRNAAPPEERPPRPLAPSALGPDDIGQSPPGEAAQLAAKRGTLLHRLFERLPDVAPDRRREAASQWLAARGSDPDIDPDELVDTALAVIEAPEYAAVFSPDALAEAPIAAVVDDVVVSGTVDRLLIGDDMIRIVDFKTGREVPDSAERVPTGYLRQMAAYRYALEIIFPGRVVEAWLLYTAGPHMLRIPETLLADHKPRFADQEQSLSALG